MSKSLLLLVAEVGDLLPCEFWSAEVASRGCLFVDGPFEVEVLDDHSGTEVEVAEDDSLQIFIGVT